jgi:MarR family transcriptional regulator, lower aerobic nicotinate degradation pathway regulator
MPAQLMMSERIKQESRAAASRTVPKRYVMEEQVGFLMRVAMQRHTSIFMSLMVHDLTQTQFAALAKLVEVGSCSQNHLGRLIYLDAATIKGVIDRLRARGLVTIQINPRDRRRSMIAVTKQGDRIAKEAISVAHQITAGTLVPLRSGERRRIVELLQKMI